jgi:hypothetical protein
MLNSGEDENINQSKEVVKNFFTIISEDEH